jgi:hypothetical protein
MDASIESYAEHAVRAVEAVEDASFNRLYSPYACMRAMLFGEEGPYLHDRVLVAMGHLPTKWLRPSSHEPFRYMPLEYAAAFDGYSPERDHFLRLHEADVRDRLSTGTVIGLSRISYGGLRLPPPRDLSVRSNHAPVSLFRPAHVAWYTPRAVVKLLSDKAMYYELDGTLITSIADNLVPDEQSEPLLEGILVDFLDRELQKTIRKRSTSRHATLADIVALTQGGAGVEAVLHRAADSYADLGVAVPHASTKTMVRGLRGLARYKQYELMSRMSRPPTLEELKASNISGAGLVWASMPWECLGPVIKEHGRLLQAELLKRPELGYDDQRRCLTNHESRLPLLKRRHNATSEVGDRQRFVQFQTQCMNYFGARTLRDVLKATYPPYTQQLLVLEHLDPNPVHADRLRGVRTDATLAALAAFKSPIVPDLVRHNRWQEAWV